MNSVKFGYTVFASHVLVKLNVKVHPNCSLDSLWPYSTLEITPLRSKKTPTLHRVEGILTPTSFQLFQKDLKELRLRTRLQESLDAVQQHREYCDASPEPEWEDDLPF